MSPEQIQELINASLASSFTSMGISNWYNSPTAFPAFHSSSTFPVAIPSSAWVIDSGASNHITAVEPSLTRIKPYVGNEQITTANGHHLSISDIVSI